MNDTTSKSEVLGNVAAIANRVDRLVEVAQIEGAYKLLRAPGEAPYAAYMRTPEWSFERVDDKRLGVRGDFEFHGASGKLPEGAEGPDDFVVVTGSFVVTYSILPGDPLKDEDILAFARLNTHLNLHPFWREFVYSSLTRANLPPLLLPPFNPFRASQERKKAKEGQGALPSSDIVAKK